MPKINPLPSSPFFGLTVNLWKRWSKRQAASTRKRWKIVCTFINLCRTRQDLRNFKVETIQLWGKKIYLPYLQAWGRKPLTPKAKVLRYGWTLLERSWLDILDLGFEISKELIRVSMSFKKVSILEFIITLWRKTLSWSRRNCCDSPAQIIWYGSTDIHGLKRYKMTFTNIILHPNLNIRNTQDMGQEKLACAVVGFLLYLNWAHNWDNWYRKASYERIEDGMSLSSIQKVHNNIWNWTFAQVKACFSLALLGTIWEVVLQIFVPRLSHCIKKQERCHLGSDYVQNFSAH